MGYSLVWVAVRSPDRAFAFDAFGVQPDKPVDSFIEARIAGAELSSGWYIITMRPEVWNFISVASIKSLSILTTTLVCDIDEHSMQSMVSMWEAGGIKWSIGHDASRSISDLSTSGEVPAQFVDLVRLIANVPTGNPADVDLAFDVPIRVAESVAGFRHDRAQASGQLDQFQSLRLLRATGYWILFGRWLGGPRSQEMLLGRIIVDAFGFIAVAVVALITLGQLPLWFYLASVGLLMVVFIYDFGCWVTYRPVQMTDRPSKHRGEDL